jgi:TPR repeat protein
LEYPEDFVRQEITTALVRKIKVIPVLIGGATVPKMAELPEALAPLSRRNAIELSDLRFHQDVDRLIGALEKALEQSVSATSPTAAESEAKPSAQSISSQIPVTATVNLARIGSSKEENPQPSTAGKRREPESSLPISEADSFLRYIGTKKLASGVVVAVVLLVTIAIIRNQDTGSRTLEPLTAPESSDLNKNVSTPSPAVTASDRPADSKGLMPSVAPTKTQSQNPFKARNSASSSEPTLSDLAKTDAEKLKKRVLSGSSSSPEEIYELGLLYETGHGIEQNFNEAAKWYALASEKGYSNAKIALDDVKAEIAAVGRPPDANSIDMDQERARVDRRSRRQMRLANYLAKLTSEELKKPKIETLRAG